MDNLSALFDLLTGTDEKDDSKIIEMVFANDKLLMPFSIKVLTNNPNNPLSLSRLWKIAGRYDKSISFEDFCCGYEELCIKVKQNDPTIIDETLQTYSMEQLINAIISSNSNEILKELSKRDDFDMSKENYEQLALYGTDELIDILIKNDKFYWVEFGRSIIKHYRNEYLQKVIDVNESQDLYPIAHYVKCAIESNNIKAFLKLFPALDECEYLNEIKLTLSSKVLLELAIEMNPKAFKSASTLILLNTISFIEPKTLELLLSNIDTDNDVCYFIEQLGKCTGQYFNRYESHDYNCFIKQIDFNNKIIKKYVNYKSEEKFDIIVNWLSKNGYNPLKSLDECFWDIKMIVCNCERYGIKPKSFENHDILLVGYRNIEIAKKLFKLFKNNIKRYDFVMFTAHDSIFFEETDNMCYVNEKLIDIENIKLYKELLEEAGHELTDDEKDVYDYLSTKDFKV